MTTGSTVFEVRPARVGQRLRLVLIVAAASALAAWAAFTIMRGEGTAAWFALPLALPIVAAAVWRVESGGRLWLDGGVWHFERSASGLSREAGELVVAMDLGAWMLLRLHPDGARWPRNPHWLALSRRDMPAEWPAFRRTVYSPRPSPAGRSTQAPADLSA